MGKGEKRERMGEKGGKKKEKINKGKKIYFQIQICTVHTGTYLGEKISFSEGGRGKNIIFWENIYSCEPLLNLQ